ncbi:hypothetical protein ILYODFUR_018559 [Ilyodon furcidens]|uniref:Uncharacterized protein n=1 Tax=Ilyodon furcidens TaxID=33524 RepID=A0ABV0SPJ3_9TELE
MSDYGLVRKNKTFRSSIISLIKIQIESASGIIMSKYKHNVQVTKKKHKNKWTSVKKLSLSWHRTTVSNYWKFQMASTSITKYFINEAEVKEKQNVPDRHLQLQSSGSRAAEHYNPGQVSLRQTFSCLK